MTCKPFLDCQLTAVQGWSALSLTDAVIVKRKTAVTSDTAGHQKPTSGDGYTTIATIDGLLVATRRISTEREMATQIRAPVPYEIYFVHGRDVRSSDRLIVNSRTFEVQGISKVESTAILDKANCVELQK